MKTGVRRSSVRSSPAPSSSSSSSFSSYLKPGALALIRYSRIAARSKKLGAQTLLALCELKSSSDSSFTLSNSAEFSMNSVPNFDLRVKSYPRCLQRKKLLAARPIFFETQT